MNLETIMREDRQSILSEAVEAVRRAHLEHYERVGIRTVHERLDDLLGMVIEAVLNRNLDPVIDHATSVATARFEAGVDLSEVQTAFNALEEALWLRILRSIPAPEQAEALGLVGTALGRGKDILARQYVSMASHARTPALNLEALFSGSDRF